MEVLALQGRDASLTRLAEALRDRGIHVDLVATLTELRHAFFQRGGHDALLIGPDVAAGAARRAIDCLTEVDDGVRVLAFGQRTARLHRQAEVIATFHPSSRAALGAVLRLLPASPSDSS